MPQLKVLVLEDEFDKNSLYKKVSESDFSSKTYSASEISYNNYDELAQKALGEGIELVITDSEKDIFNGIVEILKSYGLECIGTNRKYSRLGSSKLFAKRFLNKYDIPYLRKVEFEDITFPVVLKKDFSNECHLIFSQKELNEKTLNQDDFIEEFITGDEISVTSFYNSEKLINFEPVKIHKKDFDNIGSSCPVYISYEQYDKLQNYLTKFEHALLEDDADFKGFITSNLVWNGREWIVVNFQINIGNSTLLNHLESDLLATILYSTKQKYKEKTTGSVVVQNPKSNFKISPNDDIKIYNDEENQQLTLSTTADFPFRDIETFLKKIPELKYPVIY